MRLSFRVEHDRKVIHSFELHKISAESVGTVPFLQKLASVSVPEEQYVGTTKKKYFL